MAVAAASAVEFDTGMLVSIPNITEEANLDVARGPCTLLAVNMSNGDGALRYLKLFDALTVTEATDDAEEILHAPATTDRWFSVNPPNGLAFTTALSLFGSDTAGRGTNADPTDLDVGLLLTRG